jgi:hypothetical protein
LLFFVDPFLFLISSVLLSLSFFSEKRELYILVLRVPFLVLLGINVSLISIDIDLLISLHHRFDSVVEKGVGWNLETLR